MMALRFGRWRFLASYADRWSVHGSGLESLTRCRGRRMTARAGEAAQVHSVVFMPCTNAVCTVQELGVAERVRGREAG